MNRTSFQDECAIAAPLAPEEGHRKLPGFDALKVFCDVARCRSISQAAADNDLSQPAASLIVRQLEKRLGVQLVNRLKRPLQLTALGQLYYEGCKGLVEQYLELEASIRSARAGDGATVQVAAIYSVGLGDMGSLRRPLRAPEPGRQGPRRVSCTPIRCTSGCMRASPTSAWCRSRASCGS